MIKHDIVLYDMKRAGRLVRRRLQTHFWTEHCSHANSLGHSNLLVLFARFLWNMLVCTPAKPRGPYAVQAAYEELLLITLLHLQHCALPPKKEKK